MGDDDKMTLEELTAEVNRLKSVMVYLCDLLSSVSDAAAQVLEKMVSHSDEAAAALSDPDYFKTTSSDPENPTP